MIFHARVEPAEHQTVALKQHERLRDEVRALLPGRRAQRRDLPSADGLSIVLVLGVSERTEHHSLLVGHRQPT